MTGTPEPSRRAPDRRPRVLVADDNAELLAFEAELLEDEGFDVVAVPDGAAAWSALQAGEAFSLLLLDDDMPGVRGLDLVAPLRALGRTTPVVITSGSLTLGEPDRERLGLFAVLPKPVPADVLVATLRRALEGQP